MLMGECVQLRVDVCMLNECLWVKGCQKKDCRHDCTCVGMFGAICALAN